MKLDCILNLSASPFHVGKNENRVKRAQEITSFFGCPFIYVNRVGAEDEILFDGNSFVFHENKIISQLDAFKEQVVELELPAKTKASSNVLSKNESLTWEELFRAKVTKVDEKAKLELWSDDQCESVLQALCLGIQDYAKKSNFNKFTIALSGGIDSSLVLAILNLSLKEGQAVEAIYMPSIFSSTLSYELSFELCQNLRTKFTSLPIKFMHSAAKNLFSQNFNEEFKGIADENIQSRMRGMLIYARSNQVNSMVLNTSNKSELAVGYSTQYGDSVGAISVLGDLYKSQVFQLANYINKKYNNIIPEQIITRGPSAELKDNQLDSDSLPPYEVLDAILEGILSLRYSLNDLVRLGFNHEDVTKVFKLYTRSEYKRYQFSPIIKISSKSFGFGYRIPLSKNNEFYFN